MDDSGYSVRWPKAGRRFKRRGTAREASSNRSVDQPQRRLGDDELLTLIAEHTSFTAQTNEAEEGPSNAHPSGTCIHAINGVEVVCCPEGVVYWPATETLIVADLHLEKGSSAAARGQLIPPYDTQVTLRRLASVLGLWQPRRVIALGDSFHDETASERLPAEAFSMLETLCGAHDFLWIAGNHDPKPPVGLKGDFTTELREGGLIFRHEPSLEDCQGELSGHLHPKARLYRRGRVVRRACFAASRTRMILPSFGAYTGGLNVFHTAFEGLFEERRFHALMCGKDQVYRISAGHLS